MLTVQNDWIQYEPTPARRPAVRGGAACAQRIPVASARPSVRTARVTVPSAPRTSRRPGPRRGLRLTRRGRLVLIVLPAAVALSAACVAAAASPQARADVPMPVVSATAAP